MVNEYVAAKKILDIMREKGELQKRMISILEHQTECIEENILDEVEYDRLQDYRDEYIEKIEQLNIQFDNNIQDAKADILTVIDQKLPLANELRQELEVLHTLNQQYEDAVKANKNKMESYLAFEKKESVNRRNQKKTAAAYYKNMTKQTDMTAYFYDQMK